MSVRNSHDEGVVFLYDSVTGLPLPMEFFATMTEAVMFEEWVAKHHVTITDLRNEKPETLQRLRELWDAGAHYREDEEDDD